MGTDNRCTALFFMSSDFRRETGVFQLRVLAGEGLSANTDGPPANTLKSSFRLINGFTTEITWEKGCKTG